MNHLAPREGHTGQGWLRIGVNLFPLSLGGGGMRQYVLQLLPWLLRLSPHRLVLFHGPQGQPSVAHLLRRLHPAERNRVRLVAIDDQEAIYRHAHAFDVYFCPLNCLVPDLLDRPTLVTLADVQERFFPHYFTADDLRVRAESYPHAAHASTILLTISDFSKKSICNNFYVPPDKVVVTHLTPESLAEVPAAWPGGLDLPPGPYFFYPANFYPHKNHALLLDSLGLLRQRGLDCACVLTGQPTQPGIDIHEEAKKRNLGERVCWLRQVSPPALRHLYENAVALAFPSQFEGFGLPLVEAMLCGCPVVATSSASIPEVVGDAALLAPATAEGFADALARLLTDAGLRADLAARARARAESFTSRRLAEQTLQAIDEAVRRFWRPRSLAPAASVVRYVVHAHRGGRKLARTLASLSFEVAEHDEVLILANREDIGPEAVALADNLGMARFASHSPDAWLEGSLDFLCYLREGDCLCEGATRAALEAFAEHPDAAAVAGSALGVDRRQRLAGLRYRPAQPYRPGFGPVQPAAIFWRRDWLAEQRASLDDARWPERLLALAGERAHPLNRTVAYVPAGRPLLRQVARRLLRRLPGWLRKSLRGLYRRLSPGEPSP